MEKIEYIKMVNPVFQFIEADNRKAEKEMRKQGKKIYSITTLLDNPRQFQILVQSVIPDYERAKKYYDTWDIEEFYEFYTNQLAINYNR